MRNSILFLIVVFLSNIIQAITGFAGTVLAHRGGRFPAPLNSLKN